ncbi:hypothetical protein CMI37_16990 [Candidatus Pacearchaeota archaeon]|nr:hypothetical protein [Candidatus Pacearchaeota archaeon]
MTDVMEFDLSVDDQERRPPRLILFGSTGMGKTTFGTKCEKPVFLLTEDGCEKKLPKIPKKGRIEKWEHLLAAVGYLIREETDRETVVLDTLNAAEVLCKDYILNTKFGGRMLPERGKEGYMSWAQGDRLMQQEFIRLINGLDMLRNKRNMFVVLLAHEGLHKQGNALGDDFLKLGGDMTKYTWPTALAWADQVGHVTKDHVAVKQQGDKIAKQKGSKKRVCYFEGGPGRDAKSRAGYEMPETIEFSYENYMKAYKQNEGV